MKEKTDYIIFNKPVGCTVSEAQELLEENRTTHTHPIGDLDENSEGLLVFTTNEHAKESETNESEYEITIDRYLSKAAEHILAKGMTIEGEYFNGVTLIEEKHKGKRSVVRLKSSKTKDTDIRKMFEAIQYHVVGIRRVGIREFKLGVLSIGRWKFV